MKDLFKILSILFFILFIQGCAVEYGSVTPRPYNYEYRYYPYYYNYPYFYGHPYYYRPYFYHYTPPKYYYKPNPHHSKPNRPNPGKITRPNNPERYYGPRVK